MLAAESPEEKALTAFINETINGKLLEARAQGRADDRADPAQDRAVRDEMRTKILAEAKKQGHTGEVLYRAMARHLIEHTLPDLTDCLHQASQEEEVDNTLLKWDKSIMTVTCFLECFDQEKKKENQVLKSAGAARTVETNIAAFLNSIATDPNLLIDGYIARTRLESAFKESKEWDPGIRWAEIHTQGLYHYMKINLDKSDNPGKLNAATKAAIKGFMPSTNLIDALREDVIKDSIDPALRSFLPATETAATEKMFSTLKDWATNPYSALQATQHMNIDLKKLWHLQGLPDTFDTNAKASLNKYLANNVRITAHNVSEAGLILLVKTAKAWVKKPMQEDGVSTKTQQEGVKKLPELIAKIEKKPSKKAAQQEQERVDAINRLANLLVANKVRITPKNAANAPLTFLLKAAEEKKQESEKQKQKLSNPVGLESKWEKKRATKMTRMARMARMARTAREAALIELAIQIQTTFRLHQEKKRMKAASATNAMEKQTAAATAAINAMEKQTAAATAATNAMEKQTTAATTVSNLKKTARRKKFGLAGTFLAIAAVATLAAFSIITVGIPLIVGSLIAAAVGVVAVVATSKANKAVTQAETARATAEAEAKAAEAALKKVEQNQYETVTSAVDFTSAATAAAVGFTNAATETAAASGSNSDSDPSTGTGTGSSSGEDHSDKDSIDEPIEPTPTSRLVPTERGLHLRSAGETPESDSDEEVTEAKKAAGTAAAEARADCFPPEDTKWPPTTKATSGQAPSSRPGSDAEK